MADMGTIEESAGQFVRPALQSRGAMCALVVPDRNRSRIKAGMRTCLAEMNRDAASLNSSMKVSEKEMVRLFQCVWLEWSEDVALIVFIKGI